MLAPAHAVGKKKRNRAMPCHYQLSFIAQTHTESVGHESKLIIPAPPSSLYGRAHVAIFFFYFLFSLSSLSFEQRKLPVGYLIALKLINHVFSSSSSSSCLSSLALGSCVLVWVFEVREIVSFLSLFFSRSRVHVPWTMRAREQTGWLRSTSPTLGLQVH